MKIHHNDILTQRVGTVAYCPVAFTCKNDLFNRRIHVQFPPSVIFHWLKKSYKCLHCLQRREKQLYIMGGINAQHSRQEKKEIKYGKV